MLNATEPKTILEKVIYFCLTNKLLVFLAVIGIVAWGLAVAPFDWSLGDLPRNPVPVDAIPDIGENQQIVFTRWMGRSPQDVEDQITYPMTVNLLGIPGVKTIRSFSMFGFSSIYIIFDEDIEFYWSRSRILEKLNSLPPGTLPPGVSPALGPDATALGQVYWYTLEGRDPEGNPTGGWDLHELRTVQDWNVRYALQSVRGVSEVASIGGFVQEYQIDVDPDAMRAYHVTLDQIYRAVKMANLDVGARTIEINRVEYVIRGIGFIKSLSDIESSVITVNDNVPVYVRNVARVSLGPALRRGVLDKEGSEAVGGVVVVRYGDNPLAAIGRLKEKIEEIAPSLPTKTLPDGTVSRVTIVPFYDRTGLINETLGTLDTALTEEILVTIIVILISVMHLRSSALISGLLPLAVLVCFIAMKLFHVDANIVALSGIAIAIGTIVDMGIIICENILRHLEKAPLDADRLQVIYRASSEVAGAVVTAISTTVVSFLPVFTMTAAEGKLFKPLAFTKTFALIASVVIALTVIPPLAHLLFVKRTTGARRRFGYGFLFGIGLVALVYLPWWLGAVLVGIAGFQLLLPLLPDAVERVVLKGCNWVIVILVAYYLAGHWLPLGPETGILRNFIFVGGLIGGLLGFFFIVRYYYDGVLGWFLQHKTVFLVLPLAVVLLGALGWFGWNGIFGWLPAAVSATAPVQTLRAAFPGLGKEFMPPLDEGSYLYMPTTMTHASIGEVQEILQMQDRALSAIPEIREVVGKLGRAETPLDPAPISMIETVINYHPEYIVDEAGARLAFRYDAEGEELMRDAGGLPLPAADGQPYTVAGQFLRDDSGALIPDPDGMPFRLWRRPLDPALNRGRAAWAGITNPDDIWDEIVVAAAVPGVTSAPKLQPIATRLVMLQTGMRAPMGIKVRGPSLETIESFGLELERLLKEVPSVSAATVYADRVVGKPYLEIEIDREAAARYGVMISRVQQVIEVAIGGKPVTTTVEGRERYPVRVRYMRELRDSIEGLKEILVAGAGGVQVPLRQLARINYVRGPQVIKSEDTFLTSYVTFDKRPGAAEVDVVEAARAYLEAKEANGELVRPAGVSYRFSGSYEAQIRSQKTLSVVLPLALFAIFMILYMQFRSIGTTLLIFSGILIAWAGGFIMIWLYAQPWFLHFSIFGTDLRELFQVHPINLSVAIWVGFLALFGIASDNGVVMADYLNRIFADRKPSTVAEVREATIAGSSLRVRPCLMTSATTILALIPVLTSTGRGADIMVPMAIPSFGGMMVVLISLFIVPVVYCWGKELRLRFGVDRQAAATVGETTRQPESAPLQ